jgi:hypothetical protein
LTWEITDLLQRVQNQRLNHELIAKNQSHKSVEEMTLKQALDVDVLLAGARDSFPVGAFVLYLSDAGTYPGARQRTLIDAYGIHTADYATRRFMTLHRDQRE